MSDQRPDPDELLAEFNNSNQKIEKGRLKIFFGASAGVGKTYAMLLAAKYLHDQGTDIVVGTVTTHGRVDTAALLAGLEVIPHKRIEHQNSILEEFDLDTALERHPEILLVDELAHTNVTGSRHAKRWQDIEELLNAGINVYSTMNVQHLESLNDIVGGITGIRVRETVPDHVFDHADEVVLVDLSPDDLLRRLKEGKVYLPKQAEKAIQNFFRKGNLIALRELAMRRTADRIDDQIQSSRKRNVTNTTKQIRQSILIAVGTSGQQHHILRRAHRLATALNVDWHAVYVETPSLQKISEPKRRSVLRTLKFAQDMGAITATVSGINIATALVDYANRHGLQTILMGKTLKSKYLSLIWPTLETQITNIDPGLELILIAQEKQKKEVEPTENTNEETKEINWQSYGLTFALSIVTALIATPLADYFEVANIVMLFLLAVVVTGLKWGRGPSVFSSVVNVCIFDFFFIEPRLSFAVSDIQYVLTFLIMLIVGLITGHLTAGIRYQALVATHREERARSLYEMAKELSSALTETQIYETGIHVITTSFRARLAILVPDDNEKLMVDTSSKTIQHIDYDIAQWSFEKGEPAGIGTNTLAASPVLYLPLKALVRNRGVLIVEPDNPRFLMIPEQRRQLETFATLIAIALERVHFVTVARNTLVNMESERLRNSLLSALSHDLRTPLAALMGLTESLLLTGNNLSSVQQQIIDTMREQSRRMVQLVNNLLEMARLESGHIQLRKEWQLLEDLIGSAIKDRQSLLVKHFIKLDLPADLPLISCDAMLIERVLVNLLENAAKYTPEGTTITISALTTQKIVTISIADQGAGLPKGAENILFDKFVRGQKESDISGVGLGLAICRAIVEAHGGIIKAMNHAEGGAIFMFTLPLSEVPLIEVTLV